jgi:hypothetical protein
MTDRTRRLVGGVLLFSCFLFTLGVIALWPVESSERPVAVLCGIKPMSREVDLLLLAMVFGALGSLVHAAKSFASFAGNRALVASWTWWYALQPFVGMALALVFYVIVRGGLFVSGSSASAVSPFGIAGVSGLVGMFSKQATDKLNELFCVMFPTSADAARKDKLQS